MSTRDLTGTTAIVTGASRGFGRSVATALAQSGARVIAVARDRGALERLETQVGETLTPVVADVADPAVAGRLIDTYEPTTIVLNAGANPLARPLHQQTWETFSQNWEVDVKQAFHWNREALLRPLAPGSTVISFSSGAAVGGSPMSGGYAGAKATVRFISSYAASESERAALGIRFVAVLPKMAPSTGVGANGARAYARYLGVDLEKYLEGMGPELTAEQVGKTIVDLARDDDFDKLAYLLTQDGLNPLG